MKKRLISFLLVMTIVFGCVACAGPVVSPEPTDPTTSTTAPTDPGSPTDPTDPTDPTEPSNPTDPSDPSDPAEPTDPIVPDVPALNPDADPEEIFTKTVHDFDGYRVENLDNQEDTNFVVYAKGVQELTATATSNVLQSVDETSLTYTFKNPDDSMKALQPGDVFFIQVSEYCPEGASVKVKSISLSGDTAVIQGEEMAMSDLFVYIDAADISLDQIPVKAEEPSVAMRIPLEMDKTVPLADRTFTLPLSFTAGTGSQGGGSSISASMEMTFRLTQNRLTLRYSVADLYFEYGLQSRVITNSHMSLQCKGFVKASKDLPLAKITTPIPGVFFMIDLNGAVEGSAQINGVWDSTTVSDVGMKYSLGMPAIQHWSNQVDYSNTETDLEIEGTIGISAGIKFGLGVPEVFGGYVQPTVGYKLNGKMTFPGDDIVEPDAECIHGCDKCIEGKLTGYLNASFGIESKPFAEKLGLEFDASISTPDLEFATKDFYCAFPQDTDFEFDWGKCPYKRWRTEVTVENQDGTKVSGATVEATFADGRTDEGTTDSNGKVVLYLPNGKSVVQCTYEQREEEEEVTIDEAPETVELLLEDGVRVFYDMINLYEYQDMAETMILSAYPNAEELDNIDYNRDAIIITIIGRASTHNAIGDFDPCDDHWGGFSIRVSYRNNEEHKLIDDGYWSCSIGTGSHQTAENYIKENGYWENCWKYYCDYCVHNYSKPVEGGRPADIRDRIVFAIRDVEFYDWEEHYRANCECLSDLEPRAVAAFESELRRIISVEVDRVIGEQFK